MYGGINQCLAVGYYAVGELNMVLHRYYFFFYYIFFIVGNLKQNEIYNVVVFMDNSITSP